MISTTGYAKIAGRLFRASAIVFAWCVIGVGTLTSSPARGQVVGATLYGTVSDSSGALIPNAQVTIENVATGISTAVNTNGAGHYTAPNLIAGSYQMTATATGFETEVRTGILLEVGAQLVENVTLAIGQTTQQVQVTGAAPDMQLASSSLGAVVGREAVVELPLNGRSWTDLSTLQPGVIGLTDQQPLDTLQHSAQRANQGYGRQTSINGARPSMNNYRLDGISVNDYANGAPSNTSGETSGVDAIQEFSVLTSNYSAEYGNTAGGVINAITRSGSNLTHGSAYDFLRNSVLDARNYFDAAQIPAFRRNQFGGSIGGPIRKDRTFFFANYEGLRQLQSVTNISVVPSVAAQAGTICSRPDLVASGTSCVTSHVAVSPAAAAYLPLLQSPNSGLLPTGHGDTGTFAFVAAQTANYNLFTTRIDHQFSDKDRISGVFGIDRGPSPLPTILMT